MKLTFPAKQPVFRHSLAISGHSPILLISVVFFTLHLASQIQPITMKRITLILFAVLMTAFAWGQDISGQWNGALKIQGTQLRLVFHINKTDTGYSATMDSPDQGAKDLPVTSVTYTDSKLVLKMDNMRIEYSGELIDGIFKGTFKQAGFSTGMDLTREAIAKVEAKRSQEPVKPYPYYSEEVLFSNPTGQAQLAGTLTMPSKEGKFPVAVLISGSGPQNRNEELLGHKPFLVLSDYLTRNGIAVLRYDDRGTAGSTGDFRSATTDDLATDAEAAIAYLKTRKEIDPDHIGLIGHSEGGVIGPLVASRSKDVDFVVMMAGTGMRGLELLILQAELINRAMGSPEADIETMKRINGHIFNLVANSTDEEKLRTEMTEYLVSVIDEFPKGEKPEGVSNEDFSKLMVNQIANPWMMYFLKYDPVPALQKVKCPVLALNGELDLQVPPKENLELIKKALKKNKSVKIVEFPGMNHLFQTCKTGSPSEYGEIDQTINPIVLKEIADWITLQVN